MAQMGGEWRNGGLSGGVGKRTLKEPNGWKIVVCGRSLLRGSAKCDFGDAAGTVDYADFVSLDLLSLLVSVFGADAASDFVSFFVSDLSPVLASEEPLAPEFLA